MRWYRIAGLVLGLGTAMAGCSESQPTSSSSAQPTTSSSEAEPKSKPEMMATSEPADVLEPLPDPEGDDGLYSIAQVMRLAHQNKLYRRLYKEDFSPAVGERLMRLYSGLPKQSPPQGDLENWQKQTQALIDATQKVIDGEADAVSALKRAVNCSSCHERHRP